MENPSYRVEIVFWPKFSCKRKAGFYESLCSVVFSPFCEKYFLNEFSVTNFTVILNKNRPKKENLPKNNHLKLSQLPARLKGA
jgi:hypothetical protein